MTQVAIQGSATSGSWNSATPTIDTPAGSDGHTQLMLLTWDSGGSVVAPTISGFTLKSETNQSGTANRMAVYSKAISGSVSAGSVSPTFSASVYGEYWVADFNGTLPGTVSLEQFTSYSVTQTIPATTAAEAESLHLTSMSSAGWPRTVAAVSGYTEALDAFQYTAAQGVWLGVNHKAVGAGAVAASDWTLYDEYGSGYSDEQVNYLSIVLAPIGGGSGAGTFTVSADFPVPTITITRVGSGSVEVDETDTIDVTVVDQYGAALPGVTVSADGGSGAQAFTVGTITATDTAGEASFTITAASPGTGYLVCTAGASVSNTLTIPVVAAPSGTPTVSTTWVFDDVPFASQSLSYVVKASDKTVVTDGTDTTDADGVLEIAVAGHSGEKLLVQVENLGVAMTTAGKVHGSQVATAT